MMRRQSCHHHFVTAIADVAVGRILESERKFDRFIIETTGLADPAPIIQSFMLDEVLRKNLKLDAIVTVADAEHVLTQLQHEEAREQIAFADVNLLNKADRATTSMDVIEAHLRALNPLAAIHRAQHSAVPPQFILDVGAFDVRNALKIDPALLEDSTHTHDAGITSVALSEPVALDGAALNRWLNRLIQEQGQDLLRTKGIVFLEDEPRCFVFHGVHMTLESAPGAAWQPGEQKQSQIVFIGRNLQGDTLRHGFESCFVSSMTTFSRYHRNFKRTSRMRQYWSLTISIGPHHPTIIAALAMLVGASFGYISEVLTDLLTKKSTPAVESVLGAPESIR